jgi:ABC-2 type transport system ATP-binding protein
VLLHEPDVLLLDEPTSGLDPRARIEVKALLKELRRMGKTILISSHILSELADCCTSIGIIERGQLLMHGPIESVYRQLRRNRVLDIRFLDRVEAGVSILRSCPEMRSLDIEGNRVTVEMEAEDNRISEIMTELVRQGIPMRSFNDKEPTLEDVFMMVTKGLVT